jgi:hypothetical protein
MFEPERRVLERSSVSALMCSETNFEMVGKNILSSEELLFQRSLKRFPIRKILSDFFRVHNENIGITSE